jgi:hypothetical protein
MNDMSIVLGAINTALDVPPGSSGLGATATRPGRIVHIRLIDSILDRPVRRLATHELLRLIYHIEMVGYGCFCSSSFLYSTSRSNIQSVCTGSLMAKYRISSMYCD